MKAKNNSLTFQPDDVLIFTLTYKKSNLVETVIEEVPKRYIHESKKEGTNVSSK